MDIIGRSYLLITSGSKQVKRIRWYFKRIQPKNQHLSRYFSINEFLNFAWKFSVFILLVSNSRPPNCGFIETT